MLAFAFFGFAQAIDAAAIVLTIELFLAGEFGGAVCPAVLAPVLIPESYAFVSCRCAATAGVDLFQIFPARDAERGCEDLEAVFARVKRCAFQPQVEAGFAAFAALWLAFQALDAGEPCRRIVVGVDERNAQFVCEALVFGLAMLVLVARVDVGVIEENRKA